MKIIIFSLLFAAVCATEFSVRQGNTTCALLDLEGTVDITAVNGNETEPAVSLKFADATLIESSNCSLIKLNLSRSVQVWFQLDVSAVKPISTFVPDELFPKLNETVSPVFTAAEFGSFSTNQSFVCQSSVKHSFNTTMKTTANFTLDATTEKLQIQFGDIVNDTFSSDTSECDQDKSTTATPTTSPATSPTQSTPILPPAHEKVRLNVSEGNTTCILMEGSFTLGVTFEDNVAGKLVNVTRYLNVPQNAVASGNCSVNSTSQVIDIQFEKDWVLSFKFSKSDSSNSEAVTVSEIDVTYDTAIFQANKTEVKTVVVPQGADFLKCTTAGYYMCSANSTFANKDNVQLTATDFKYKAFNDNMDPEFNGDDVAECPADEETSSVVPIAVGAALAGLVVIVLIAYLIGRRRSRKSGYESV